MSTITVQKIFEEYKPQWIGKSYLDSRAGIFSVIPHDTNLYSTARKGARIDVLKPGAYVAHDKTESGSYTSQGNSATHVPIYLNNHTEVTVQFTDIEKTIGSLDLMRAQMENMAEALMTKMRSTLYTKLVSGTGNNYVATDSGTLIGSADMFIADKAMKNNGIYSNRYAFMTPNNESNLLQDIGGTNVNNDRTDLRFTEGFVTKWAGFNVYSDPAIIAPTNTDVAGTTSVTAGDTSITVTVMSSAIAVGSRFTIADDTTIYTASAVSHTGTTSTVTVLPAIQATGATKAVTILSAKPLNMFLNPACATWASRNIAYDSTDAKVSEIVSTQIDEAAGRGMGGFNITVKHFVDPKTNIHYMVMETLWGCEVINSNALHVMYSA